MAVTILVPTDLSPGSQRAIHFARDFARQLGEPHLVLVHAYHVPVEIEAYAVQHAKPLLEALSDATSTELDALIGHLQESGVSCEYIARSGRPEIVVHDVAAELGCDYIVMMTHGRTGIAHAALGSVAERVIRRAPCPVITLKA
jgi:nucleotide-binding universal stress UspA family protein